MAIVDLLKQELNSLIDKNIKSIKTKDLVINTIENNLKENLKYSSVYSVLSRNKRELENLFDIKILKSPKERTFDLNSVLKLIEYLKKEGIYNIAFPSLIKIAQSLYKKSTADTIRTTISKYKYLFNENGINMKSKFRSSISDEEIDFVLNEIAKKTKKFSKKYLVEYFKKKGITIYQHTYESQVFLQKMKYYGLEFESERKDAIDILEKFSNSPIVEKYIAEKKEFSANKIAQLLENSLSTTSILNYTSILSNLGIPLKENSFSKNLHLSDEETIQRVMKRFIKEDISEFTYPMFNKYRVSMYLNYIDESTIRNNMELIEKSYDIKFVARKKRNSKGNPKVNDVKNKILKEKETINQKQKEFNIIMISSLPSYNSKSRGFYFIENTNLIYHWQDYLKIYLNNLKENRINVRKELFKNEQLDFNTPNKEYFFLFHEEYHIKDLSLFDIVSITLIKNTSNQNVYGIHRQNMIIGFLLYLHSLSKLLFPLEFIIENYFKNKKALDEINIFLKNKIMNLYNFEKNYNRISFKELKRERLFQYFLLTIKYECRINEVNDDYFILFDKVNSSWSNFIRKLFKKLGSQNNENSESLQYTKKYYNYMKSDKYKELIKIFNNFMNRKIKLNETKSPKQFLKSKSALYCQFLDFLNDYYPTEEPNKPFLYSIFNFPESKYYTFQEHISKSLARRDSLNLIFQTFSNSEGYENILNKNKIPYSKKIVTSRNAIEDEVIHKIDDIVTNRPPASSYFKKHKVDTDISWWKHIDRIIPFEPLLIKLHLRVPARGGTLRLIDRDKLLQYDAEGNIKGFLFVSDKNKNRTEPFIVPNIWRSELSFLKKLVEYSREYFPKPLKYYPDDNNLKNGIIPLFPNQDGTKAYTPEQHLIYWRRVLILAHIELLNEGKDYKLAYSNKVKLPQSIDELDELTDLEVKTFKIAHDIHSLRTTGITNNIMAGMPLELVRMLSGHSGFNTILTFYFSVNQQKLVDDWLEKKDIDITEELDIHKTTELFIKEEVVENIESINPNIILEILNNYGFFNLLNRTISFNKNITLKTISKSDPKFWKPTNGGICTSQNCPKDLIQRCSLCPYFISNYMFMPDIGLQVQLHMAKIKKYNDMIIRNRKNNENEKNAKLRSLVKESLDDFVGWLEVLELANVSYKENYNKINLEEEQLVSNNFKQESTYAISPSLTLEHGYLDILLNAYKCKVSDEETIVDITNQVANKLIRYHSKNNTYHEIEGLENEQIVLNFLPKYEKISQTWFRNDKDKKELEYLLNIIDDKNKRLEYINENTFLTE